MEENKYELLVQNSQLYPPEFIIKYGTRSAHWELESWQRRERSLCHDMLCILLSNLEPSETLEEKVLKNLKRRATSSRQEGEPSVKRAKRRFSPVPGPSTEEPIFLSDTESDEESSIEGGSDEEYDPTLDFMGGSEDLLKYRYIVLEGSINSSEIQSYFSAKWDFTGVTKIYDIVDTKEKKFIELKTTTNIPLILKKYSEQINTSARTALIVVDLHDLNIDSYNKDDEMPGLSKAYNFLIQRKALMRNLGLEDRDTDEGKLSKIIFKSDYINQTIEALHNLYFPNINKDFDLNKLDIKEFKIEPILKENLFKLLRKPLLERYDDICSYKGKITPFFYCDPLEVDDEKDLFAVDHFLVDMWGDLTLVEGDNNLLLSFEYLRNVWFESNSESKHFTLIDAKKSNLDKIPTYVKSSFRIGKKGKSHNNDIENPKQPEREKIPHQMYPEWFEQLYTDMAKENKLGVFNMGRQEAVSSINLYAFLGEWLTKFYYEIGKRNVGGFIDQIANFYSRISGTFNTTVGNKTTHSSIAAVPIKMVVQEEEQIKRWVTGVAFRGPHHTRSATDKSNFLIVEKISSENPIPPHFYKGFCTFKSENGAYYMLRQTSIRKIDGIHLTFIRNSLFIASNMIGDIIMRHSEFKTEDAFKALCTSHLINEESRSFFIDRVIDAVLMATLGNARDEGYFSMFRKFFMVLINDRRQQSAFTFDVKGMCDKLNECLIDNPLSMFFQNSLIYMICND